jgi:hypothetical protein
MTPHPDTGKTFATKCTQNPLDKARSLEDKLGVIVQPAV